MSNYYRIATICPAGMSQSLRDYLASKPNSSDLTMRDIIAINLLKPFENTNLPFCATIIGWAKDPELLQDTIQRLSYMQISKNDDLISAESFSQNVNDGIIQIMGAYPLLDAPETERTDEYIKVSFVHNREATHRLLEWIYKKLIYGAMKSDEHGIIITIIAKSEELADMKTSEAVTLLEE